MVKDKRQNKADNILLHSDKKVTETRQELFKVKEVLSKTAVFCSFSSAGREALEKSAD